MSLFEDFGSKPYSQLIASGQKTVNATFLLICCCNDDMPQYYERGIMLLPLMRSPDCYERAGYFDSRCGDEQYLQQQRADGDDFELNWGENPRPFRREAFGLQADDDGDTLINKSLARFAKRLRNHDVSEIMRKLTLLLNCSMRTLCII
jgi:hypothetical protein